MAVREGRQRQGIAETQELELEPECLGPRDGAWIRELVVWHVLESAGEWREGAIGGVKGPEPLGVDSELANWRLSCTGVRRWVG
jgi:hypothetical protein